MRLEAADHLARPWRIHEIAPDFELVDVWALPTPGERDDFPLLVRMAASLDPEQSSSSVVRALFDIRFRIGRLLGWDDDDAGLGSRVRSLRDRLPQDLRDTSSGPDFEAVPFAPLYLLEDEFAGEIANRTVHGVLHLGWVTDDDETYRGQLAILVKTNGLLGRAYLAAIAPFRHLIVYPSMLADFERRWRDIKTEPAPAR